MAKPSDPDHAGENFEATLIGRLARLAYWRPEVLQGLAEESLLILDRYYGQAPLLGALQSQCEARDSHFLVRVRDKLNVKVRQAHADGSAAVVVIVLREPAFADEPLAKPAGTRGRTRKHPACKVSELEVREVRGRVLRGSDGKWVEVRLWTSLSPQQASVEQLPQLDARRWEQEMFYKEIKLQINQGDLLAGRRTGTAQQQVAAMMIACSLLAEEWLAVAGNCEDEEVRRAGAVRISFSLCQECVVALFMVLQASQGLMDASVQGELVRRVRAKIAAALPPHRQMAAHARAIFNAYLETLRRLADCLAALGLNFRSLRFRAKKLPKTSLSDTPHSHLRIATRRCGEDKTSRSAESMCVIAF